MQQPSCTTVMHIQCLLPWRQLHFVFQVPITFTQLRWHSVTMPLGFPMKTYLLRIDIYINSWAQTSTHLACQRKAGCTHWSQRTEGDHATGTGWPPQCTVGRRSCLATGCPTGAGSCAWGTHLTKDRVWIRSYNLSIKNIFSPYDLYKRKKTTENKNACCTHKVQKWNDLVYWN